MNTQTTTFETVLKLVKQLSFADQLRLMEWLMGQLKQRFTLERDSVSIAPKAGSAQGMVTIADDFDEPLDDFKEYM